MLQLPQEGARLQGKSKKPCNVEREIRPKVAIYNDMIDQAESRSNAAARVRFQRGKNAGGGGAAEAPGAAGRDAGHGAPGRLTGRHLRPPRQLRRARMGRAPPRMQNDNACALAGRQGRPRDGRPAEWQQEAARAERGKGPTGANGYRQGSRPDCLGGAGKGVACIWFIVITEHGRTHLPSSAQPIFVITGAESNPAQLRRL